MSKIFIGGIPYNSVQGDFVEFCERKVGKIQEISWITDRNSGNFRGFCFVIFEKEEDSVQAVLTLNNMEFDGRMLRCASANPMKAK